VLECPKPSADFFPGHATALAQNPKNLSETPIYLIDGTNGPAHIRDQRDISLLATLLPCSSHDPRRRSLEGRRRDYFLITLSDGQMILFASRFRLRRNDLVMTLPEAPKVTDVAPRQPLESAPGGSWPICLGRLVWRRIDPTAYIFETLTDLDHHSRFSTRIFTLQKLHKSFHILGH
jgi:hypothetical protein